jgi:hypothetical protein
VAVAYLRLVRHMRTRGFITAAVISIGVIGVAGIAAALSLNPLRRSDSEIRKWVLQKTPIGSTRDDVMAVVAKEHWEGHPEFRGVPPRTPLPPREKCYGADLGSYQSLPWRCRADAFWTFGVDDRVADVYVSSWCEGL